jgi:hypothetical protein
VGLDQTQKGTWNDVKAAFRVEWPPVPQIEISSVARRATMMSHKLLEEDLEGEGRKRNYTHALWADKVEPLWKRLKDKNGAQASPKASSTAFPTPWTSTLTSRFSYKQSAKSRSKERYDERRNYETSETLKFSSRRSLSHLECPIPLFHK